MFGILPQLMDRIGFRRPPPKAAAKTTPRGSQLTTPEPSQAAMIYDPIAGEMKDNALGGEPALPLTARRQVDDFHEVGGG